MIRAQSHVIGLSLMLGLTVVALGGLTVTVGSVIDAQTASADATRVAEEMDSALEPVETTGPRAGRLHFTDGRIRTVERNLSILKNGSLLDRHEVGALVFEADDHRVVFLAGALVRGHAGNAWLAGGLPVTASERNDVVVVGVPQLQAEDVSLAVGGGRSATVVLRTNVSHDRTDLGWGRYAVTVETTTPRPFERYFEDEGASVSRRDFDGDGVESVVATYPGHRRGYRVVHNLSLEVDSG